MNFYVYTIFRYSFAGIISWRKRGVVIIGTQSISIIQQVHFTFTGLMKRNLCQALNSSSPLCRREFEISWWNRFLQSGIILRRYFRRKMPSELLNGKFVFSLKILGKHLGQGHALCYIMYLGTFYFPSYLIVLWNPYEQFRYQVI